MALSHDAMCWIDWFGDTFQETREHLLPNWHYEHIHNDVLPALLEAGVSEKDVDAMLVGNPRHYFTRQR